MKKFAQLLTQLEKSKNDSDQELVFLRFLKHSSKLEVMWSLWLLTDRKPKKCLLPIELRDWTLEETAMPDWLYEESLAATGDVAETCALLWRKTIERSWSLAECMDLLLSLAKKDLVEKKILLTALWRSMDAKERYWMNRLLLGSFRFKTRYKKLIIALAAYTEKEAHTFWYRLFSDWSPREISFAELFLAPREKDDWVKPYSFPAFKEVSASKKPVKEILDFQATWYWEGIWAQLIKRSGQLFIWSKAGAWLTGKFPEFDLLSDLLPDGMVFNGRILGLLKGRVLEGKLIKDRAAKKKPTKKILSDCPAIFLADDFLENQGKDLRALPFKQRRALLEELMEQYPSDVLNSAEELSYKHWSDLKKQLPQAREVFAKGMLLRQWNAAFPSSILFLPCPPLKLLVVLLYVSRDERKPGRFADLSFGVWKNEDLVPIAKCRNTLPEEDQLELKKFVQQCTIERFGPVTSVEAQLVFEIAYTGLILSARKKSGLDLQFPVLLSWEKEKTIDEAEELSSLLKLQRKLSGQME